MKGYADLSKSSAPRFILQERGTIMSRTALNNELNSLNADIANMAVKVERILHDTMRIVKYLDKEAAIEVYKNDNIINAIQNRIEQQCVNIIALQQPLATDLRNVTATLKMVTDVERVADQCADICEIVATYPELNGMPVPAEMLAAFDKATEMFSAAVDAFIRKDRDLSVEIISRDDAVDAMFSQIILNMSTVIREDNTVVSQATDYMFIAKYIERIADHATNIAEWTIYAVSGVHKNMSNRIFGDKPVLQ